MPLFERPITRVPVFIITYTNLRYILNSRGAAELQKALDDARYHGMFLPLAEMTMDYLDAAEYRTWIRTAGRTLVDDEEKKQEFNRYYEDVMILYTCFVMAVLEDLICNSTISTKKSK
jgi:hypothetical protein